MVKEEEKTIRKGKKRAELKQRPKSNDDYSWQRTTYA